jgi:hypothetical protein
MMAGVYVELRDFALTHRSCGECVYTPAQQAV